MSGNIPFEPMIVINCNLPTRISNYSSGISVEEEKTNEIGGSYVGILLTGFTHIGVEGVKNFEG